MARPLREGPREDDLSTLRELWPNVAAALQWIDRWGDRDGDGFVEYETHAGRGLTNQGWKDSEDSIVHADGRLAEADRALRGQGYVYAGKRCAARLAARCRRRRVRRDARTPGSATRIGHGRRR